MNHTMLHTKEEFLQALREVGIREDVIERLWNAKPLSITEFSKEAVQMASKLFCTNA